MSQLVFTYGTLKRGQPNHPVMNNKENGSATFLGSGETIRTYPLVVGTDFSIPFLMPVEGQGHNVQGEVYLVDDKMLAFLDEFESVPDLYVRNNTDISLTHDAEGKPISPPPVKSCGTYFLVKAHQGMMGNKWLTSYSSISKDHGEYVVRSERMSSISLARLVFSSEGNLPSGL